MQSKQNVNSNNHPTVKPTDLMRYLVRLVTPKRWNSIRLFYGFGFNREGLCLRRI